MTFYFDLTMLKSCTGILVGTEHQLICTGTGIHTEDRRYRGCEAALRLEQENDLHFWFGEVPRIGLYTVPLTEIGGYDSRGGYFAGCPDFSLGDGPMYYIDREKNCWRITENSREFASMGICWRERMVPAPEIRVFGSFGEARERYPIRRPGDEKELLEMLRSMEEAE